MGDMNPFWQTLDSVFGAYFNATTNETESYYTTFFHPVSLMPRATPCRQLLCSSTPYHGDCQNMLPNP